MKERREKGLCYNCDGNYSQGHRCKTQQLYPLDGIKTGEDNMEPGAETTESELEYQILDKTEEQPEISFHAILGAVSL